MSKQLKPTFSVLRSWSVCLSVSDFATPGSQMWGVTQPGRETHPLFNWETLVKMVREQILKVQIVLLSLTTVIKSRPNIIVILADDIGNYPSNLISKFYYPLLVQGVNDVSWNNKNSKNTPNLRRLAKEGVILDNAYTLPVCTPSRAALMTGIYPFKMGLQRGFGKQTPEGIPLNKTILPEYLKDYGYSTHGLGKVWYHEIQ